MNFKQILHDIEGAKAEDYQKVSDRRDILKSLGNKVVAAALPFSLGGTAKGSRPTGDMVAALNEVLEIAYFEYAFYHTANNTSGLIPTSLGEAFSTMEAQKKAQIAAYASMISAHGGNAFRPNGVPGLNNKYYVPSAYNFTKRGNNPVFEDYKSFLSAAQAIENAGMQRQAMLLETAAGSTVFGQVQQMATTKARHAAHIKMLRMTHSYGSNVEATFVAGNFAPRNTALQSTANLRERYRNLGLV